MSAARLFDEVERTLGNAAIGMGDAFNHAQRPAEIPAFLVGHFPSSLKEGLAPRKSVRALHHRAVGSVQGGVLRIGILIAKDDDDVFRQRGAQLVFADRNSVQPQRIFEAECRKCVPASIGGQVAFDPRIGLSKAIQTGGMVAR